MNLDENITDVFDRFLNGQMSEAEAKEFLQQLDTDPALKEAYEWHRTIVAGIREARRDEMKDYIKQHANIRYIGNVWSRSWIMTSAAIITIFLVSYVAIQYFVKPAEKGTIANNEQTDQQPVNKDSVREKAERDYKAAHPTPKQDETQEDKAYRAQNNASPGDDSVNTAPHPGAIARNDSDDSGPADRRKTVDVYVMNKSVDKNKKEEFVLQGKNITQQFWVYFKPANTYNYQYSKDRLTLYKVKFEENIALYKLSKGTYLNWNSGYYPLKQDGSVHSLVKTTDTSVLNALPKQK